MMSIGVLLTAIAVTVAGLPVQAVVAPADCAATRAPGVDIVITSPLERSVVIVGDPPTFTVSGYFGNEVPDAPVARVSVGEVTISTDPTATSDPAAEYTKAPAPLNADSSWSDILRENSWLVGLAGFALLILLALGVFVVSGIIWMMVLKLLFGGKRRALASLLGLAFVIYLIVTGTIPFSWGQVWLIVDENWGDNLPLTGLFILILAFPIGLVLMVFGGGGGGREGGDSAEDAHNRYKQDEDQRELEQARRDSLSYDD